MNEFVSVCVIYRCNQEYGQRECFLVVIRSHMVDIRARVTIINSLSGAFVFSGVGIILYHMVGSCCDS